MQRKTFSLTNAAALQARTDLPTFGRKPPPRDQKKGPETATLGTIDPGRRRVEIERCLPTEPGGAIGREADRRQRRGRVRERAAGLR